MQREVPGASHGFELVSAMETLRGTAVCYRFRSGGGRGVARERLAVAYSTYPSGYVLRTDSQPGFHLAWRSDCDGRLGRDVTKAVAAALAERPRTTS